MFARSDGAPANWFLAVVTDDPWLLSGHHDALEGTLVCDSFASIKFLAPHAPEHAPASATRAALAEEFFHITPARWSGGTELKEVCVRLRGHQGSA